MRAGIPRTVGAGSLGALLLLGISSGCRGTDCGRAVRVEPTTGLELRLLPLGDHRLGSPPEEADREAQETPHTVRVDRCVWLGSTEVTQVAWNAVLGEAPSAFPE